MALNRLFRGILGIATTWGVAFSTMSIGIAVIALVTGAMPSGLLGPADFFLMAGRGFLAGSVAGGFFAALVAWRERGTTVSTVSDQRIVSWGVAGGVAIPVLASPFLAAAGIPIGVLIAGTVTYGVVGGAMGAATLRVARRAPELVVPEPEMSGTLPPIPPAR